MERLSKRRGRGWKPRLAYLLLPLAIVGAIGVMNGPLHLRSRTAEADTAMLASPAPINGQRAYGYLKQICEIGPRTAGSEPNKRQRKLVADHFIKKGATVREQPFRAQHPMTGQPLVLANLIGSWNPDRLERVVIGAHYDTRPHPDEEDDPQRHELPFLGANDGASGVALLMELANHLTELQTPWGVDLVLFDGEELVFGNNPRVGEYFLGSREFARIYADQRTNRRSRVKYAAGLVLDMVGGRDLQLNQEPNSLRAAPDLVRQVWAVARSLNATSFRARQGREVLDDHLALIDAGIPAIDLIDFEYRYWHKADDLPENCSADSLAEVGRVVTAWLALPRQRSRR
jgi:hypothetical protein